jgi:hypothetical protein
MKNVVLITLNNNSLLSIDARIEKTSDTIVKVNDFQLENAPLLLEIEHQQINTLLELNKVNPYVLLYFCANGNFKGAAFSLHPGESLFSIKTQFKTVLFLPYPIQFQLEEVQQLTYSS